MYRYVYFVKYYSGESGSTNRYLPGRRSTKESGFPSRKSRRLCCRFHMRNVQTLFTNISYYITSYVCNISLHVDGLNVSSYVYLACDGSSWSLSCTLRRFDWTGSWKLFPSSEDTRISTQWQSYVYIMAAKPVCIDLLLVISEYRKFQSFRKFCIFHGLIFFCNFTNITSVWIFFSRTDVVQLNTHSKPWVNSTVWPLWMRVTLAIARMPSRFLCSLKLDYFKRKALKTRYLK